MIHPIYDAKLFRIYSSPFWWKLKAETLKHSGELCRKDTLDFFSQCDKLEAELGRKSVNELVTKRGLGTGDVEWAMFGFSLEVLLKGIIYHRNPRYIFNGSIDYKSHKKNQLPNVQHHDLERLFIILNENLNYEELSCCRFLHNKMKNYRYPVPNFMHETQESIRVVGDIYSTYKSLYERLNQIVDLYTITGHLKTPD